jgi:hypothetical protein
MPLRTYLHVGLYKTGTTALQQHFFPFLSGNYHIGLLPGPHPWRDDETELAIRSIVNARRLSYDPSAAARPLRRHLLEADGQNCTLAGISYENFPAAKADPVNALERIAEILGADTRILLVVRRPMDWLRSAYSQQLRARSLTLTFGDWVLYEALRGMDQGVLQNLLFYRYYRALTRVFSSANVLVLPYCMLHENPALFVHQIAAHMGTTVPSRDVPRVNVSPAVQDLELLRQVNMRFRRWDGLPAEDAGLYDNRWRIHEFYARLDIEIPRPIRISLEHDVLAAQALADARAAAGDPPPMSWCLPPAALKILAPIITDEVLGLEEATGLPLRAYGYTEWSIDRSSNAPAAR